MKAQLPHYGQCSKCCGLIEIEWMGQGEEDGVIQVGVKVSPHLCSVWDMWEDVETVEELNELAQMVQVRLDKLTELERCEAQ